MLIKPAPSVAFPVGGTRLVSLDFWRGLCLLMIFVNHIPDNPATLFTLRWWGFADAAEVFVFISGINAMLALGAYFAVGGFTCGLLRVAKRLWQLFCAHVLLVFALAVIIAAAGELTDSKPIMAQLNFSPLFVETDSAIMRLAHLGYMPSMTDILPLYIAFVAIFPVIWLLIRVSPLLALAASASLWLWANLTGASFANYPDEMKWFFNPLAWQFLFVCGAVAANCRPLIAKLVRNNIIISLAASVVIVSLLAAAPWTHYEIFAGWRLIPPELLAYDNKQNLSLLRIIYFLSLVICAVRLLPETRRFWQTRPARLIALSGRHALAIYCTGAILALTASILLPLAHTGSLAIIAVDCGGIIALLSIAYILQKASRIIAVTAAELRNPQRTAS